MNMIIGLGLIWLGGFTVGFVLSEVITSWYLTRLIQRNKVKVSDLYPRKKSDGQG